MLRITHEREQRGWSRSELARRASMNAGTVGQIELRRYVPYPRQLQKLARALRIPAGNAESLLEDTDDPPVGTGQGIPVPGGAVRRS
jgi:transcriptional regulator with XRE-family HTH domain